MASRSLNQALIIGNLTRDPELKYTPAGTAVCTFGVATNRSWKTNDGQQKEEVQYHRIVAWQKLAELCGKLLTKGKKVFLQGRLTYRTFTGRDGQQKSITEIVLDDFIVFGDGRKAGDLEEVKEDQPAAAKEAAAEEEIRAEDSSDEETSGKKSPGKEDVNPDDIPF